MRKKIRSDEDYELKPQSVGHLKPTALVVAVCAALVVLASLIAVAAGLCATPVILYAVVGLLAAMMVVCVSVLLSTVNTYNKYNKYQREAVCKRIHGVAAGDPEAVLEDAYDYQPVDGETCQALSAALAELEARGSRARSLADKYSETSLERDDYQFRMLGAQMIPGMIERAIRKIGRTAEQRKINDIAAFSRSLCDLMDSSLQASKKPTSLAGELGLIRTYLDLDDAITGRRTEYRMSVMCSIVGYKLVPHLILPVVENLLEHSERAKDTKYELAIEIAAEQDNMAVIIRDNGRGIDVDTLERIQRCLETNTLDSDDDPLSLPSINRRVVLCYGDRHGLKVSSSKMGTSVKISLPVKPEPIYAD